MSIGALLLRFRFAAKPFESSELDSLASRMSVLPKMSTNPADRWFKGVGSVAYSTKTRVIFGRRIYEKLTEAQQLALAAHELVHIREGDARYVQRHVTFPALICGLGTFLLSFAVSHSLYAALSLAVSGWLFCTILSIILIRRWRRAVELRCDVIAASFVNGQELISALKIQDSLISPKQRHRLSYWVASKMFPYPSMSEREEAISRVIKESVS